MEADVDRALVKLLDKGKRFDCQDVADLVAPRTPAIPALSSLMAPDLAVYDRLLARVNR